jgi:RND family efflux transporter MFP subunit
MLIDGLLRPGRRVAPRLPASRFVLMTLLLAAAATTAACGGPGASAAPPAAAPVRVTLAVVEPKALPRTTEYVATLRSRRSSEIRPQVEGIITRIHVRSGDRVRAGARLVQVDPLKQEAAVSSSEASRAAQEAQLRLLREELGRQKALFAEGLVSRQSLDQATAAVDTAEASLKALAARERESRVELQYYGVTAPTAGVVGDIPVRVGDRVTPSTVVTTIDENAGLEAYIYVPVERAPALRKGLPVQVVDDRGAELASVEIDFVSPQVDDETQAVLVKAPVPAGRGFRTEQFVRARIVWESAPALTVPALAVTRINGQYFAYVAEAGDDGLVARQRLLKLGELAGNDYRVIDGLEAGERLVTSGVQKLADGVAIAPTGA